MRICPKHLRPIVTDADWDRPRPWQVFINQQHRDSNAALIDRPRPTTFIDTARLVLAKLGATL